MSNDRQLAHTDNEYLTQITCQWYLWKFSGSIGFKKQVGSNILPDPSVLISLWLGCAGIIEGRLGRYYHGQAVIMATDGNRWAEF